MDIIKSKYSLGGIILKTKLTSIILIISILFVSSIVYGEIDIEGESALLMDFKSGEVIYSKNQDKKLAPASITKIMTLLIAMESLDKGKIKLTDQVVISEYASSMGGTQLYLDAGEEQTVENLIKAISVRSANDAAVALGEHIAGSNESFLNLMNAKAKELKMENTHFSNSTGLPKENHYTTAYDIAIMSRELLKYRDIIDYLSTYMEDIDVGKRKKSTQTMVNTNKLVKDYKGITGIKTGFTNEAKHCISASAKRDNLHLISIIMGAETSKLRFNEAKRLLDYGFSNYESINIGNKGDIISIIPVEKGRTNNIEVVLEDSSNLLLAKGEKAKIKKDIDLPETIKAPIEQEMVVGRLNILVDNQKVDEVNLIAKSQVKEAGFLKLLNKTVKNFIFHN